MKTKIDNKIDFEPRITRAEIIKDSLDSFNYEIKSPVRVFDYGKGIIAVNGQSLEMYLGRKDEKEKNLLIDRSFHNLINVINYNKISEQEFSEQISLSLGFNLEDDKTRNLFKNLYNKLKLRDFNTSSELEDIIDHFDNMGDFIGIKHYGVSTLDEFFNSNRNRIYDNVLKSVGYYHKAISLSYGIDDNIVLGGFYYAVPIIDNKKVLYVFGGSDMYGSVPSYESIEKYFCESGEFYSYNKLKEEFFRRENEDNEKKLIKKIIQTQKR